MKNRHFLFYSIILAALVAVYVLELQSSRITRMETGYVKILPAFDTGKVRAVNAYKLSPEKSELRLVKNGETWVVANKYGVPADPERVKTLLKEMSSLKGEVRTKTEDNLSTFWLEDRDAVHIELLDGDNKPVVHLLFGKKGETGETTFVRKAGDPTVYSALIRLNSAFQVWDKGNVIDPVRWCDLRLKDLRDWHLVVQCDVFLPDGQKAVFKKIKEEEVGAKPKDEWIMAEPVERKDIPTQDIGNMVAGFAFLRGDDVLDPTKKQEYGLDSAPYRVVIHLQDGTSYEENLSSLPNGQYAVALKDGSATFRLEQQVFERTFGKAKELLQSPPPAQSAGRPQS